MSALSSGLLQGLVLVWPVLALAIAYRLFRFPDISVEGSFLLGAASFAVLARLQFHPLLAIAGGVVAGALVGSGTALLHGRFGINKFLAGILITSACYSIALRLMSGSNVGLLGYPGLFDLAEPFSRVLPATWPQVGDLVLCLAILAGCLLILSAAMRSRSGLKLRAGAIGGRFARNAGLSHTHSLVLGLATTGAISAFGGVLMSMRQGFADIGMNQGVLVLALASLSLGEGVLPSKKLDGLTFVLLAATSGSILYQILVLCTIKAGLNTADIKLITAALVLLIVCLRKDHFSGANE